MIIDIYTVQLSELHKTDREEINKIVCQHCYCIREKNLHIRVELFTSELALIVGGPNINHVAHRERNEGNKRKMMSRQSAMAKIVNATTLICDTKVVHGSTDSVSFKNIHSL